MEGPGMSLFQGAASIHINNSAQDRLEEQEELEDQKRRNEELKNELANAFDDLVDDDEASSVNSSGNFTLHPRQSNGGQDTRTLPVYTEPLNGDTPKISSDVQVNYIKPHLQNQEHGLTIPYSAMLPTCGKREKRNKCNNSHLQHINEVYTLPHKYNNSVMPVSGNGQKQISHDNLQHPDENMILHNPVQSGGQNCQNHYFHQAYGGHLDALANIETNQDYMNNEQLKVMYEMRVKECQQLASQMEKLDTEIDSLRARLAAAISDKDKAELSLQEAHHLLASSKHELIELQQQVTRLTEKLVENEQEKEQLKLELRSANISLQDVQQRLHTLQVAHTHDTDALFKEQQDRHREEIDRLQDSLTLTKNRLAKKENEIKILEKCCMEKDREKNEILIEKGATINRLASELEVAQSRLGTGETVKLKEKMSQLTSDRNAAREQVKELGSKLEVTAHELVLCRNKLAANQKEYDDWRTKLHQILMETLPDNTYIGKPSSSGYLKELKEVLNFNKQQIQKIEILQEELIKKDEKIKLYHKQESLLKAKVNELTTGAKQIKSRVDVLESNLPILKTANGVTDDHKKKKEQLQAEIAEAKAEIEKLLEQKSDLEIECNKRKSEKGCQTTPTQEANTDLMRELDRYNEQLTDTIKENGELKTLYLQACSSRDTVSRELKNLQSLMKQEKELFESLKKDYVTKIEKEEQQVQKLTIELTSCKDDLEKANKWISELQREFSDKQKEFNEKLDKFIADEKSALRREKESCAQCEQHIKQINVLEEKLEECKIQSATIERNQVVIKELRNKASFFTEYIMDRLHKVRALRTVGTNTEENGENSLDNISVKDLVQQEHDDSFSARVSNNALMEKEKAIREQLAKKFSVEIKNMELNCARKIKATETEHLESVKKLKDLLKKKVSEIENLKEIILSERAKVTEILESKENEISVLIKEHNELQAKYQKAKDDEEAWKQRYKENASHLSSLEEALKNEKDLEHVRENKITKLKSKLAQIEQKYKKIHADQQSLEEKYKNVKKTIITYKDYITKKDTHINNEINRIQVEYRKIFDKLQNELNHHVNCRVQEGKKMKKGKQPEAHQLLQYDYAEQMKKLNEDFTKLAQNTFKRQ